ncbi:Flp family type IVb pilin [Neobacillus vireti]|uniref:Flp family type IVb pilin n=1 Tax=Neobacillus vireti TaxID=220686 RepID=UPI002FFF5D5A
MMNKFKALVVEEQGQGMTEYGLILGLVALAAVVALTTMGGKIKDLFTNAGDKLTSSK